MAPTCKQTLINHVYDDSGKQSPENQGLNLKTLQIDMHLDRIKLQTIL